MSEEEIINQVKDIMADREYFAKNYEEDDNIFKRDIKALQGILDLYDKEKAKSEEYRIGWRNAEEELEKEKEKNKKLEHEIGAIRFFIKGFLEGE